MENSPLATIETRVTIDNITLVSIVIAAIIVIIFAWIMFK